VSEPNDAMKEAASKAGIYERPETPGYHAALIGGGPFGSFASLCIKCAALVGDTDNAREVHDRFAPALPLHQPARPPFAVLLNPHRDRLREHPAIRLRHRHLSATKAGVSSRNTVQLR
jgi:hypothetical protein